MTLRAAIYDAVNTEYRNRGGKDETPVRIIRPMRNRYAVRKDANHNPIVEHLERNGVEVLDCAAIGNVPDILVYYNGRSGWIEIKVEGSRARFEKPQLKWIAATRFPVRIVTNKDDALVFAQTHAGQLTESQKYRLGVLVAQTTADQVSVSEVDKIIK